jgi:hypothetical protein
VSVCQSVKTNFFSALFFYEIFGNPFRIVQKSRSQLWEKSRPKADHRRKSIGKRGRAMHEIIREAKLKAEHRRKSFGRRSRRPNTAGNHSESEAGQCRKHSEREAEQRIKYLEREVKHRRKSFVKRGQTPQKTVLNARPKIKQRINYSESEAEGRASQEIIRNERRHTAGNHLEREAESRAPQEIIRDAEQCRKSIGKRGRRPNNDGNLLESEVEHRNHS